jgi:hypothetical protein
VQSSGEERVFAYFTETPRAFITQSWRRKGSKRPGGVGSFREISIKKKKKKSQDLSCRRARRKVYIVGVADIVDAAAAKGVVGALCFPLAIDHLKIG